MWAGSRLEFLRPLAVGSEVTRRSRIESVKAKQGRSGVLESLRRERGEGAPVPG